MKFSEKKEGKDKDGKKENVKERMKMSNKALKSSLGVMSDKGRVGDKYQRKLTPKELAKEKGQKIITSLD